MVMSDMSAYSRIIFGSSTWKSKILLEDWEDYFLKMRGFDFSDKKIAFFGTGDQKLYPGTFVDSMGYIHQQAVEKGAKSVGCWSTDGYLFADSYGIVDGEFVGLAVDEHNQPHKTMKRVADWVDSIYSDMIH
jgi:flavodoxin I